MLERLYDHHCHHSNFGSCQKSHRRHSVGFILAPGGGGCCDNYGVPYRVPVSSRHQRSERTGEKEAGKILVLTSSKATDQIFQEGNTRRIQVWTASIHFRCNFNRHAQRQRDLISWNKTDLEQPDTSLKSLNSPTSTKVNILNGAKSAKGIKAGLKIGNMSDCEISCHN